MRIKFSHVGSLFLLSKVCYNKEIESVRKGEMHEG